MATGIASFGITLVTHTWPVPYVIGAVAGVAIGGLIGGIVAGIRSCWRKLRGFFQDARSLDEKPANSASQAYGFFAKNMDHTLRRTSDYSKRVNDENAEKIDTKEHIGMAIALGGAV